MEETSHFGSPLPSEQPLLEQLHTAGSTCDAYRVRLYGKLHFLKRLKQKYANDIRYVEAFRKEFEVGYSLEHPNLVRYLSFSDDGILMEYVDGETLTDFLQSHPDYFKDQDHSDKFVHQMLRVMQYLHDHQVLHLDLKPDNILITRIGHDVKLVDLGGCYADSFDDTTAHTDAYAAPEQLSDSLQHAERLDVGTDLYAFGRILQQLPCCHRYKTVITHCIQSSPVNRPTTVEEIRTIIRSQRHHRLLLLSLITIGILIASAYCVYILFLKKSTAVIESAEPQAIIKTSVHSEKQETDVALFDSIVESPSSKKMSALEQTAEKVPSHPYTINDLRKEIERRLLPIYQQTYGLLADSVSVYSEESYTAGYEMQDSIEAFIKELIIAHGTEIPTKTIADEVMEYVHELLRLQSERNRKY